ncbi:MAG: hypothetical protein ACRC06_17285 [Waterburya sp.]
MSKIQITELQESKSELNVLDAHQTSTVVGGYGDLGINIAVPIQINNNVNVQVAFGGNNYNYSYLNNNSGVKQD